MSNRLTRDEQIARMKKTHEDRYGYELWGHPKANDRDPEQSIIVCRKHGPFIQSFSEHARGQGCPDCAAEIRAQALTEVARTPERRAEVSEMSKALWRDPNYRARVVEGLKKTASTQAARDRRSKISKSLWQDPEYRAKMVEKLFQGGVIKSKGENYVKNTLESFGLVLDKDFEREKFIPNTGYRFDFWLPYYNLIIEYHGEQHYKGWSGKPGKLSKKQRNDGIKEDWAKERGHHLLVIPYWDFEDIPIILSEALGLN